VQDGNGQLNTYWNVEPGTQNILTENEGAVWHKNNSGTYNLYLYDGQAGDAGALPSWVNVIDATTSAVNTPNVNLLERGQRVYSPNNQPTKSDVGLGNVTNDAQVKVADLAANGGNVVTNDRNNVFTDGQTIKSVTPSLYFVNQSNNSHIWFRDGQASNADRALIYWHRSINQLRLRSYSGAAGSETSDSQLALGQGFVDVNIGVLEEQGQRVYSPNNQPTKSDVGLGNVPNVDATNADNITSGTLSRPVDAPYYRLGHSSTTSTLDLAANNVFTVDASSNRALSFANAPGSGQAMAVVVRVSGNAGTITWPSGINWAGGSAPQLKSGWTVVNLFWDGSSWHGFTAGGA